jgi:hypothetical protein
MRQTLIGLLVPLLGTVSAMMAATGPPPSSPQGQAAPAREVPAPATGTARIVGRVVAADTGATLRRVQVICARDGVERSVFTGADGGYECPKLAAGRYTVTARRSGFVTLPFGARKPLDQATGIELRNGQTLELPEMALPRGAVIAGRATDQYGDPLVNALVGAERLVYTDGIPRFVAAATSDTDDLGEYRISGLVAGKYFIHVSRLPNEFPATIGAADGTHGAAFTYYPGVVRRDAAQAVSASTGQQVTNISFQLATVALSTITGTVTTSRGEPAVGATVIALVLTDDPVWGTQFPASVGADGRFVLRGVPPGDYDLVAETRDAAGGGEVAVERLTLSGSDVSGLALLASPAPRIAGVVSMEGPGTPFRPEQLRIVTSRFPRLSSAQSILTPANGPAPGVVGRDGTFATTVTPGRRTIGVAGLPTGWMVRGIVAGGRDVAEEAIDFKPGQDLLGLRVVVTNQLTEVSGRLVQAGDRPAADVFIAVFAAEKNRWPMGTRAWRVERPTSDGRFTVTGLAEGAYLAVAVEDPERDAEWGNPDVFERLRSLATPLTIGAGAKSAIDLKLVKLPAVQ